MLVVDIWNKCDGKKHINLINEKAWRIIEAQEITATRKLVDSFDEQVILEDLLESTKPHVSAEFDSFHPLLYTPFRYPPLKHGSRFGRKTEPSLWYGSLELNTAMAEKAFYQFNFLRASEAVYNTVQVPLTVFSTKVKTEKGIKLTEAPFAEYTNIISSPNSYDSSQQLGAAMRDENIQAFTYFSARSPGSQANIALFSAQAFLHKKPEAPSFQSWQCIANNNVIEFTRSSAINTETIAFPLDRFLINGRLPFPVM